MSALEKRSPLCVFRSSLSCAGSTCLLGGIQAIEAPAPQDKVFRTLAALHLLYCSPSSDHLKNRKTPFFRKLIFLKITLIHHQLLAPNKVYAMEEPELASRSVPFGFASSIIPPRSVAPLKGLHHKVSRELRHHAVQRARRAEGLAGALCFRAVVGRCRRGWTVAGSAPQAGHGHPTP